MADIAIIAANVRSTQTPKRGVAGAAITAGQSLAKAADGSIQLFDANSGTAELRVFLGMSVGGAAIGQPILYVDADAGYTPGGTVAIGDLVIGSATPGAICLDTDAVTGWWVTFLGIGIGNNQIALAPLAAGAAKL